MTYSMTADGSRPGPLAMATDESSYVPGVCNIGPEEIEARRRSGHVGVLASVVLFAVLVVIDAPSMARWLLVIPVAVATSGYLQAYLHFCAGFGALGEFNFGARGEAKRVVDRDALRRDRIKALQIGLAGFVVGVVVAAVAVALPV